MKNINELKLELTRVFNDSRNFPIEQLELLSSNLIEIFKIGGRLYAFGNGGSAAEANHLVAEFVGKCVKDHRPFPAVSLNSNTSTITAIANDYGYDQVFVRQVEANVTKKDVVIGFSTSGSSPNVRKALIRASEIGAKSYLWTSVKAESLPGVSVMKVYSNATPRIQEIHLVWAHFIAEVFELYLEQNRHDS